MISSHSHTHSHTHTHTHTLAHSHLLSLVFFPFLPSTALLALNPWTTRLQLTFPKRVKKQKQCGHRSISTHVRGKATARYSFPATEVNTSRTRNPAAQPLGSHRRRAHTWTSRPGRQPKVGKRHTGDGADPSGPECQQHPELLLRSASGPRDQLRAATLGPSRQPSPARCLGSLASFDLTSFYNYF